MTGELTINGYDAYDKWGISLEDDAMSALFTPASNKDYVSNESRLENGKRVVVSSPKSDSRDVILPLHLCADSKEAFLTNYLSFCEELKKGALDISTKYQDGVTYHFVYVSCTQFSQFMFGIAKFSLKLTEPNPTNRT